MSNQFPTFNNQEQRLEYFFSHHEQLKEYAGTFYDYILRKCIVNGIYPSIEEIKRFLNKEITFEQIRDRWEEKSCSL